ncbi:DNA-binding response regulator [Nostoc sp. FACHB-87]|uniref:DNA-binding response regulator n=1 Tax=Nostocaceae TaxID=1162 RepID=UPI001681F429|nr:MULTISPECIES: DNA-binding response regulator [Nostocaceae]MBD2303088.1 DNA-binding response regulator [Nostoc sp. FACHB-190]MBD2456010.1 DNA-binding response regulator [Nostoc sp. FACHB-87]MBD2476567.1 DNA-binding response regulator [Anabaena sp. FACHB-83]
MSEIHQQEINDLRALNLTPKQIARKLGIKVSEVNAAIQNQAQQTTLDRLASGELNPVYQCLASENLLQLLPHNSSENVIKNLLTKIIPAKKNDDIERGLGLVVIAREARYNQITVCSYLLDVWCLGIKDTIPPRTLDRQEFKNFVELLFEPFPQTPKEIPLEVAAGIIFSTCEYAENLGFKPHKDFEKSRSHVGNWDGKIRIECGRNGKPCFVSGPYDNSKKILETLKNSKGEGNFDFIVGSAPMGGDFW